MKTSSHYLFHSRNPFIAIAIMASAALFSGCHPNFHEVDPGKLYRSAQLSGEELDHAIHQLGIRTVINLRGEDLNSDWYKAEAQVTQTDGVKLINIAMSAKRLPHRNDLIALLDAFEKAERPILVHCQAGADRTGEASAIYEMEYMGKSREEALEMLTLKYDHLELAAPAKRYFINLYGGKDWAYHTYDPCVQSYKYYDQQKFCSSKN
ncbi:MAG: dual specificity protein phosphatase family protein [Bdellovibrionia bacterium]